MTTNEHLTVTRDAAAADTPAAEMLDMVRDPNASARLSAKEATRIITTLVRTSLGLPQDVAFEVVGVLEAAMMTAQLPAKLAGKPKNLSVATQLFEEALRKGKLQDRIYRLKMVDAENASKLLGSVSVNPRQYANKRRLEGALLGVPHKNSFLYPAFQFDIPKRALFAVVEQVNKLLQANRDPWGVASWWTTPSERLRGQCPYELLGTHDEPKILQLAEAELEPIG
ncbi:MAG: hypothetical protein KAI47_15595 [Deltaproteobacteria bacterium]|nr:hypothetical protein [Deltaproteobacteria bacterium]